MFTRLAINHIGAVIRLPKSRFWPRTTDKVKVLVQKRYDRYESFRRAVVPRDGDQFKSLVNVSTERRWCNHVGNDGKMRQLRLDIESGRGRLRQ